MNEQSIQCPHCGQNFALDAAFREHFEDEKRVAVSAAIEQARQRSQADLTTALKQQREQILAEAEARAARELAESRTALARLKREHEEQAAKAKTARDALVAQGTQHQQELERARQAAGSAAEQKYRLELEGEREEKRRIEEQLHTLQRRMQQGSMETQGEALEIWLQKQLESHFPLDSIAEVKKGLRGADIVQQVINPQGQRCGAIVWETKNAKNWTGDWLAKNREDRARAGADIGIIVSRALPQGLRTFDLIDGVWVSCVESAPALGMALRQNLLQVASMQRAMSGREGKMEAVYAYLVSERFRDRVQRIVATWEALRLQVDREERAMQRQWKERRKQLDAMIDVTTDMYTDISAVIGADNLPQVEGLGLASLPAGD